MLSSALSRVRSTVSRSVAASASASASASCFSTRSVGVRSYSDHAVSFMHVDTPDNNANTPFDFSPELYKRIDQILAKYPPNRKRSATLPLLDLAQRQCGGWVPLAAMNKIAQLLEVAPIRVYEVATFYSMVNRKPVGKYHLQVCVTSPCMVKGSDEILHALEKHLGIHLGETTADGVFTLGEMECMGCCVNAPMIAVADYSNPPEWRYDYYEDLTTETAIKVVEALRKGDKTLKIGPQNGRKNCEPQGKKTSLFGEPRGPYCRDL
ncbi:mitochondrial Complex I (CI) NADH:ubiquinone oxidoreductase subunit 24-kDa/NUHM/NDUFV2/NuoE [Andalucia godoyi]|uniref:Mitochondrial Complex I (CI) NADH:ubiquinone oxidoreductase subunit 24-kDa/NUHM/NDUFV2/NuoE n=1 Tax=Andalucia godoyi TaxID=505711 RepID=A0A8K0AIR7_ANDGO|nr:mitochondrial Complex I (CI) NADH:ubiquinone oxidoreductase subunit 24-kDa/NUHM/NDUFV2/NuoE [Andalucia godoyi]|eukprot:ANDGO_02768.mRNA.1 mitochondrial Complex I (CI) NADH:ubiquinone oxidoreductase subunit 24-kDa/NUHM/NDUFV2/NuoE